MNFSGMFGDWACSGSEEGENVRSLPNIDRQMDGGHFPIRKVLLSSELKKSKLEGKN